MPSTAHLKAHQWKPGQSGNPSGSRKKDSLEELVRIYGKRKDPALGRAPQQELASKLWEWALAGEPWAVRELLARLWPIPAKVELSGELTITDSDREVIAERFGKLLRLEGESAA